MPTVYPNDSRNTHHIKFYDNTYEVGAILCDRSGNADPHAFQSSPVVRQAIKFYQGDQRLSDLVPPWTDLVIDDFGGGRGVEKHDDNPAGYWDSRQLDTTNKGAILGPMEIWDRNTTVKKHNTYWPTYASTSFARRNFTFHNMNFNDGHASIAVPFVAGATYDAYYIYFYAKVVGDPPAVYAYICNNAAGVPDMSSGVVSFDCTVPDDLGLVIGTANSGAKSLTSGTTYWLVIHAWPSTESDYISVVCDGSGSGEKISSTDPLGGSPVWEDGDVGVMYYRIEEAGKEFRAHFAELKGTLYCGTEYSDGSTSKVFLSGLYGKATAGAAGYIRDSDNATIIADDIFNTGILRIVAGTGHHVPSPWRFISDTKDSNSEIDVTPNWGITPDTTSEYAVVASDFWSEVTGHGLAANEYITDALSVNGAIYFACGPGTPMIRLRTYLNTGTYWQWADESAYATFIKRLSNAATSELWIANRTLPSKVQVADAKDCTGTGAVTALSFSDVNVGDLGDKITGLVVYGEDYPILYIFKEGGIYKIVDDIPQELRIAGYGEARDERNGYASVVSGVYLFFSFLDSAERFFAGSLDDIGPNRRGGMPANRRGMISSMVSYAGVVYASIDGGDDNYSSIIAYNGRGWHEIWRAPIIGKRILGNLFIQPVPGDNADRMYFSWNGNIMSLSVMANPFTHNTMGASENFQYYAYAPGGSLETGWIHFNLENVEKLFNSVTITGENLGSGKSRIFLDYKLDDDTVYTTVGQFTIDNDTGKLVLDDVNHNITGKRIRLRIRLETLYNNSTPKIDAIVVEGLVTVPSKQKIDLIFRIEDNAKDLIGGEDNYYDADTKLAQLRTWAASAGTIGMSGHIDELNGLRVKLDYPGLSIIKHKVEEINGEKRNVYIVQTGVWVIG